MRATHCGLHHEPGPQKCYAAGMTVETPEVSQGGAEAHEHWYAPLTKVTPVSKVLALVLFIALPFIGFWFGVQYANERADGVVPIINSENAGGTTPAQPISTLSNTVTPSATTKAGVTFAYPPSFSPNTPLNDLTDTYTLNNFGSKYQSGGTLPEGGCDIVFTSLPPLGEETLDEFVSNLSVNLLQSTDTLTIDGHTATRIIYTNNFEPYLSVQYVDVYVSLPSTLHKFSLSYNRNDAHEAEFQSAFGAILNSIRLPQ